MGKALKEESLACFRIAHANTDMIKHGSLLCGEATPRISGGVYPVRCIWSYSWACSLGFAPSPCPTRHSVSLTFLTRSHPAANGYWLKSQGLTSVRALWMRAHGYT